MTECNLPATNIVPRRGSEPSVPELSAAAALCSVRLYQTFSFAPRPSGSPSTRSAEADVGLADHGLREGPAVPVQCPQSWHVLLAFLLGFTKRARQFGSEIF